METFLKRDPHAGFEAGGPVKHDSIPAVNLQEERSRAGGTKPLTEDDPVQKPGQRRDSDTHLLTAGPGVRVRNKSKKLDPKFLSRGRQKRKVKAAERQRDKETERQRDRQTERQRDRQCVSLSQLVPHTRS
uniref:Uncharacterized protein n=1 Tax=Anabas testudineus TaxID=64144 RepID=A0A7N6F9R0_ANATE